METVFSKLLIQLRKKAGFSTAYGFYHDNGGKGVFKISYRGYLMIERGKNLPIAGRLGIFIWALRLISKSAEANALLAAWLRTMTGEETFRDLIEPLMAVKSDKPGLTPMQKAMEKSIAEKKYFFTVEQVKGIYATYDSYQCYLALTNDTGSWTKKEVATRLMMTEAAADKALRTLAGVKLLKEIKKGVYKCPIVGMMKEYPNTLGLPPDLREKVQAYDDKLAANGTLPFLYRSILRADEPDFRNFFPIMGADINTASTYAIHEKTEKSALFMVEGRVIKLRDF